MLNENGIYDIYGMSYQPFWQQQWFYWLSLVLLIVGCAGFVFLLFFIWEKRKKALAPWDRALYELAQLEKSFLRDQSGKTFYLGVSNLFKTYLNERFSFQMTGKTDQEIINYLKDKQFVYTKEIEQVLSGGQEVKFAGQKAISDSIKQHAHLSRIIIERTIPEKES